MASIACGTFDVSNLSADEYISFDDKTLWMKAEVEEKIIIYNNRPHAIIKFSNKLEASVCEDNKALNQQLAHKNEQVKKANAGNDPNQPKNDEYETKNPTPEGTEKDNIETAQSGVDVSDINTFGFEKPAVMPVAVVVPMKSNIVTYGPYISANFATPGLDGCYGGTAVETNPDLCPWVFGSIASMNNVGNSIVQSKALGLVRAETGSTTIPGLPVSGLSRLGESVATVGPTLSSMSFSFGSNGITTTYDFSTYTPKFGSLTGNQIDRMKSIAKFRQEQIKFLRTQAIQQNKTSRQLMTVYASTIKNKIESKKPAPDKNTTQRVFMAEMYDYLIPKEPNEDPNQEKPTRTIVVLGGLEKATTSMGDGYGSKAYMSLDGLFGPITLSGGGNLPQLAKIDDVKLEHKTKAAPIQPQPPFSKDDPDAADLDQYNLLITGGMTLPVTNKFKDGEHHHEGPGMGHAIDLLGREDEVPKIGLMTSTYNTEDEARYSDDYRFIGLRGPLMIHGWGYDTEGKPIPNAADTVADATKGEFETENLKDKFLTNWLQKPKTWPVAPLDLRFDRARGVWVTPQGYKIIVARLTESLSEFGSAKAKLINKNTEKNEEYGAKLWDKDGEEITASESTEDAFIKVVDRVGNTIPENTYVYAYYDVYKSEYIVLTQQSKESLVVKFALVQDKSVTTKTVTGIIVDDYGYPLKTDGITQVKNQNEFDQNTITLYDPYLDNSDLPAPKGPGTIPGELSAFGPALGSASLQEHVNGIVLTDGCYDFTKTIGPFIGYAIKRPSTEESSSGIKYEIITLENFAESISGKIGTVNTINGYYYGARLSHANGVTPVGRNHGNLPNRMNAKLIPHEDGFRGLNSYIVGDLTVQAPNGNIYDSVDGCDFTAILDRGFSTPQELVYRIIQCETAATICTFHIKDDQVTANKLNKLSILFNVNNNNVEGDFGQGFMWDPNRSPAHYNNTTLQNGGVKDNDLETGEIIDECRGMAMLTSMDNNGNLTYTIVTKSEIANIGLRILDTQVPRLFGCPDFDNPRARAAERIINDDQDNFWDGLSPKNILANNLRPKIDRIENQQWMTYKDSIIVSSYDEYGDRANNFDGEVDRCTYKIIYAQEAPVIMTCIADDSFTPTDAGGIKLKPIIGDILPSCQGADKDPITTILQGNVFNPMGFGAVADDLVTIQRVFVGRNMNVLEPGHPICNYKYIVIGTGKPPAVP